MKTKLNKPRSLVQYRDSEDESYYCAECRYACCDEKCCDMYPILI